MTEQNRIEVLEKKIQSLELLLAQQQKSSVMLVRRDLELSRALEKNRTLDAEKSKFISVAAHQLRTPLSGVRWALEQIIGNTESQLLPDDRVLLMKALETNIRLIRIVNEMLDVDRIETNRSKVVKQNVSMHDLLINVMIEFSSLAENSGVALNYCNNLTGSSDISTDKDKVRAIMQNLIENAIKYTPRGGAVEVCIVNTDTDLVFSVTDTGIGIPIQQQPSIFKKFFRASNAMKVQTDGSGVGMYIVNELAKNLGATVSFTSSEGKGTTFTVAFPHSPFQS